MNYQTHFNYVIYSDPDLKRTISVNGKVSFMEPPFCKIISKTKKTKHFINIVTIKLIYKLIYIFFLNTKTAINFFKNQSFL